MIDVTYGILHYNPNANKEAEQAYIDAVASFFDNCNPSIKKEVYLIDQASQPDLTKDLANKFDCNSILMSRNVGISRGINFIANLSRGKYVSLITSDVIFEKEVDNTLLSELETNTHIYQICPVSDNASNAFQKAACLNSNGKIIENTITQELTIQYWPKSVFDEKIGFYDERWKACFENIDFALRSYMHGGTVAVSQKAFCKHKLGMCIKSGARNQAYDGYIHMPNSFNQEVLHAMWSKKWHGLQNFLDWSALYEPDNFKNNFELRTKLNLAFWQNLYLPYIQKISY